MVVVGPARLSVVVVVVVNAIMGPAIRVPRSSGLVTAEALTAAASVQPDSEPGAGWAIVQNNRVAHGIGKRALAAGVGQAGEGVAAIGGNRCARDVDRSGVAASRIIVSYNDLVGIIWVTCSGCLGLCNIRRCLGASD